MRRIARTLTLLALMLAAAAVSMPLTPRPIAAQSTDPFDLLRSATGTPVTVPPRALAVIPERHMGRLIRVVDDLVRIEPQFDDLARGVGLSGAHAIQLRTREANIPIFVAKTDATISTVLQLRLGTDIEVTGILLERGSRYLMLASEVRASPSATAAESGSSSARTR